MALPTDERGILTMPGPEVAIPDDLRPYVIVVPDGQHVEFLPTADKPRNVVEAISRVMDELPGIGKDEQASEQQGGYKYRGIEAITREAQNLFARYGVVFAPEVLEHEVQEIVVNNRPWSDTRLLVRYTVYGPGGVDDKIVVGPLYALGRDNSDKGANKCMTQAFKYALLQVLCISDAKDDNDSTNAERDERQSAPPAPPPVDPEMQVRIDLRTRINALEPDQRIIFGEFCDAADVPRLASKMTDEQMELAVAKLDKMAVELSRARDSGPSMTGAPVSAQAVPSDAGATEAGQPSLLGGETSPEPAEDTDFAGVSDEVAEMDLTRVVRELQDRDPKGHVESGTPGQLRRRLSSIIRGETDVDPGEVQGIPPEAVAEIMRDIESMVPSDVDSQLDVRGVPKTGNRASRKMVLQRILIREMVQGAKADVES